MSGKPQGKSGLCSRCGNPEYSPGRYACLTCKRAAARESYYKHQEERQEDSRVYQKALRRRAIEAYGGATPSCACCGESTYEFLAIDHINGGGTKHRAVVGSGSMFYRHLEKEGWPSGYQILCHNCNFAKRLGPCPHQRRLEQPN